MEIFNFFATQSDKRQWQCQRRKKSRKSGKDTKSLRLYSSNSEQDLPIVQEMYYLEIPFIAHTKVKLRQL